MMFPFLAHCYHSEIQILQSNDKERKQIIAPFNDVRKSTDKCIRL